MNMETIPEEIKFLEQYIFEPTSHDRLSHYMH